MRSKDIFDDPEFLGGAPLLSPRGLPVPLVIAEAGVNHEGNMDIARRLIDEACLGGAHAVKFQSYKAESLACKDSPAYWDTSKEPAASQYELFKRHDGFWKNEFEALKKHCDAAGVEFMSTPFDLESARFLNDLVEVFKISSSDITNKPFIRHICAFGKPVILSTGASYPHEIMRAVSWIREFNLPLALLHCVLNYPTADENACLGRIRALRSLFPGCVIGYSDHTLPGNGEILTTAVLLGARIVEKHFTHDKTLPGNDHYHAMDKEDLAGFMATVARLRELVGRNELSCLPSENPARSHARRSLVTAGTVRGGARLRMEDLTCKRPAGGISPAEIDQVLEMRAREDLAADTVLHWRLLE
ncbi:MAG: N-acetylneuraminate synthase family protein [Deltaproteobacteria bacterium]|jgi:N-acetylneuraminate synthase|nr:N-acetylneuraminate synthase family protein [Deltaproteobacteria bacterium]